MWRCVVFLCSACRLSLNPHCQYGCLVFSLPWGTLAQSRASHVNLSSCIPSSVRMGERNLSAFVCCKSRAGVFCMMVLRCLLAFCISASKEPDASNPQAFLGHTAQTVCPKSLSTHRRWAVSSFCFISSYLLLSLLPFCFRISTCTFILKKEIPLWLFELGFGGNSWTYVFNLLCLTKNLRAYLFTI